jgi:lipoprotein-anchoring transpeptidase ErfK/SrfK
MSERKFRTTWVAAVVAGVMALAATTGAVSIAGAGHGDVARAAVSHQRTASKVRSTAFTDGTDVALARSAGSTHPAGSRPGGRAHHTPFLLVDVPSSMAVHARPRAGTSVIGQLPASSKYYHVNLTAWILKTAHHGAWGRVEIPYEWPRRDGWIPLHGLHRSTTGVEVHVDLSKHWVSVKRFGKVLAGFRAATGASYTPTPPGQYFVTDRIPFSAGGPLGSFAFGISGIQPHLPAGWSGGNQLAIHGTSDPSSIGRSASAGCVRVSEDSLHLLLPLLKLGTPVVIVP